MKKNILLLLSLSLGVWSMTANAVTVSNADELFAVAAQSVDGEEFSGQIIELTRDIDLGGRTWTPIGTKEHPFKGTLEGNGHLVKGLLRFDSSDGIGLFGHVSKEAAIKQVGICNSTIVGKPGRRIGAIAGVCDGILTQCWSTAQIVAAGDVVGGLVGELTANGSIIDSYHAGLIRNADDTIGCIVGRNAGTLKRVINTGYAVNGKAITGFDANGTYNKCYYDRKMYYMKSGVEGNDQVIPIDQTADMFALFAGSSSWSTDYDRYPVLKAFETTDAAKLSAAPVFINETETDPVNHANDLTADFSVSTVNGIQWASTDERGKQWIQIEGDAVHVVRPCTETEVMAEASLGAEKRVVYFRPRRLEDFKPGKFMNMDPAKPATFCYEEEIVIGQAVAAYPAENGWEDGDYFYRVDLFTVSGIDTVFDQTLIDANQKDYDEWAGTYAVNTTQPGVYVMRRWAHDEACVPEWTRSKGQFVYRIFPEFDSGEITAGRDTVYLPEEAGSNPYILTVPSNTDATGGGGPITYTWKSNNEAVPASDTSSLTCPVSQSGTYIFTRTARDSAGCAEKTEAEGSYVLVAFDHFDPGQITETESSIIFCYVEQAEDYTIKAVPAKGGSGRYRYQWYLVKGADTTAIEGATGMTLPVTMLSPTVNSTYTVVRKAEDDTRFTSLTLSGDKQVSIHIASGLEPGAIFNGALPNACIAYDAGGSTHIPLKITEVTPASGDVEPDKLQYQWIRNPGNVTVATTCTLDTFFYPEDLEQGQTYTFIRRVANPGCDYMQSAGAATLYFDRGTLTTVPVTACEGELPYTMTWIDGSSHAFTADGDTWRVSDKRGPCQADTVFVLNTVTPPVFAIEEEANLCLNTGLMSLYFEQHDYTARVFHITYSPDLEKYMGRTDTIGWIETPGMILFHNIPNIGTGDCYLTVQIGYAESLTTGICFSESHKMNLNVSLGGYIYSKYDRVLFVDNNPENDALEKVSSKLEFVAYQWYRNGVKMDGQTNQFYHEDGRELNGTYYVLLTDTKGNQYRSCDEIMPKGVSEEAPKRTAVYPVPVEANAPLTIEGEGTAFIRSLSGEMITRIDAMKGGTVVNAPRLSGIYYVQVTAPDGTMEIHKLIVK